MTKRPAPALRDAGVKSMSPSTDPHGAPQVTVVNPGTRPELVHAAIGLADAGMLKQYVTDIAFSPTGGEQLSRLLPDALASRYDAGRALRTLPDELAGVPLVRRGTTLGWINYAARQVNAPKGAQSRITRMRNRVADRATARQLCADDDAAIFAYSGAAVSMKRCAELGVRSILNIPIAHYAYARRLLEEEARLEPDYAATLQFPARNPEAEAMLADELALADRILGCSSFHIETFVEMGIEREKFLEVPLGVDTDVFRERPDPTLRAGKDRAAAFRVLFVGQVTQRKGLSYLLEGFRQAAIPSSELTIVGNIVGTDMPLRRAKNVTHIGARPRTELPEIYASADVFVMPSLIEGFCLTAMEAMATGLPAIVTRNTFGDDVVRDGVEGWTIPIRDSGAIAERLGYLSQHPDRARQMGKNARSRAEQFSWAHFHRRLAAVVADDLGRGGAPPAPSRPVAPPESGAR
jgi:starch synthase